MTLIARRFRQIAGASRHLKFMKIITFIRLFLFLYTKLIAVKCFQIDRVKIARMVQFIENKNQQFHQMETGLLNETQERNGTVLSTRILELITNENEYYFAIKTAILHNNMIILIELLRIKGWFDCCDVEIDFFILILIPKLNLEATEEIVNALFDSNLRAKPDSIDSESPDRIGTISIESIQAYLQHLWDNPEELSASYPIYNDHFHNPRLSRIISDHTISIKCFDLIAVGFRC